MTDDRGAAALAERLRPLLDEAIVAAEWGTADGPEAETIAAAILGEHGRFLPDGGYGHEWVEGEDDDGCCGWVCGRHITDHGAALSPEPKP